MDKQKGTQTVIIALLSIAILVMSVGFAAGVFNSTLNIGGSENVTLKQAKWKVNFKSGSYIAVTTPTATPAPTYEIGDTDLTFTATLKYGEKYEFTAVVENSGTIDAQLKKLTMSSLNPAQQKYLKYTVTYAGTEYTTSANDLSIDLPATAGSNTATVKVSVEYKALDATAQLPEDADETVTLTANLYYVEK